MARGYEVEVSADARDFDRAIRNDVIEPVEDAEDALQDFQRQGEKTGKAFGNDISTGAKKGLGDVKSEAGQTARETAASFDGSAESIGEAFQEVAANAFAGFGPAGTAAGLAAAAGLGVAIDTWNKVSEAEKQASEDAYSYAFDVIESGKIVAGANAFKEFTQDTEKMAQAQDIARVAGMNLNEVVKAMSSGEGLPALWEAFEKGAMTSDVVTGRVAELEGVLKGAQEGFKNGAAGAELWTDYLYQVAKATGEATGEVDYLGRSILTLPDGKEVVIDAATQTASENITRVEQQLDSVDGKEAVVKIRADASAADAALARLQAKAARGIDVIVRPGQVLWE